jgi:hypothetical protein
MKNNYNVLVLNVAYEPIGITTAKSVVKKIISGNPLFIEEYYPHFYTAGGNFTVKIPAVVRINKYINVVTFGKKCFSKANIYARDRRTCVYCGTKWCSMTIDHVIPRSRGGLSTYDNMVTACKKCNCRKGNMTPEEANMKFVVDIPESYNPIMDAIRVIGDGNEYWSKFITK